jgi:hypothetical protein
VSGSGELRHGLLDRQQLGLVGVMPDRGLEHGAGDDDAIA